MTFLTDVTFWLTLAGVIIGVLALVAFWLVERIRAPDIEIEPFPLGPTSRRPFKNVTKGYNFLHLRVTNTVLPIETRAGWIANQFRVDRRSADHCEVWVSIWDRKESSEIVAPFKADWDATPEPPSGSDVGLFWLFFNRRGTLDLPPNGKHHTVVFAFKYEGEKILYGFNVENYRPDLCVDHGDGTFWRHRDRELDQADCILLALVEWGGHHLEKKFLLRHRGTSISSETFAVLDIPD